MAILRPDEIRNMRREERLKKLKELKLELFKLKARLYSTGGLENPAKIREVRRAIARILTIEREEELKGREGEA